MKLIFKSIIGFIRIYKAYTFKPNHVIFGFDEFFKL